MSPSTGYLGTLLLEVRKATNSQECQLVCQQHEECRFHSHSTTDSKCELFSYATGKETRPAHISGTKYCPTPCSAEGVVLDENVDLVGETTAESTRTCRLECQHQSNCAAWSFNYATRRCLLKASSRGRLFQASWQSGAAFCAEKCAQSRVRIDRTPLSTAASDTIWMCTETCSATPSCRAYSFDYENHECALHSEYTQTTPDSTFQSGETPCEVPCTIAGETIKTGTFISDFVGAPTVEWCRLACQGDSACQNFGFDTATTECKLYSEVTSTAPKASSVHGTKYCSLEDNCLDDEITLVGEDVASPIDGVTGPHQCQSICQTNAACQFFSYSYWSNTCYLKKDNFDRMHNIYAQSGPRECSSCIR